MDSPNTVNPTETRGEAGMYLQFGHESQAHYHVPVADRNAFVTLARPRELTRAAHYAFDGVLHDLRHKLEAVLNGMPEYAKEPHVEPRLNICQPGNYLRIEASKNPNPACEASTSAYLVTFSYGKHRHALVFDSPRKDMQTTRRAVNRLLETILLEQLTNDALPELSVESAIISEPSAE